MQQGLESFHYYLNKSEFDSIIKYLVNEYQIDPNTFLYDWKYDTTEKYSIMSQLYIDLGNYLSGRIKSLSMNNNSIVVS